MADVSEPEWQAPKDNAQLAREPGTARLHFLSKLNRRAKEKASALQSSDADDLPPKTGLHESSNQANTAVTQLDRTVSTNRLRTFYISFKYLLRLSPRQVDDFMASYVIYNLDWNDEESMILALGPEYQQKVGDCLRSYYGVLNHLCALGDVEKMYIPPLMDRKVSVLDNQLLYEESVARDVALKPADKVLDLGCGRGRVAAHMSSYSGAQVTGLNIDPDQVEQAWEFNNRQQSTGNSFVVHDQNDLPLPFDDHSFDAVYEIQALSLCKDLPSLFRELFRILKPGARLSLLDWVRLPAFDHANPQHANLLRRVKPLIGAVGTPTPSALAKALEDAGFVILRSDNASIDGLQAPLIQKVDLYFRVLRRVILGLVGVRVLPVHFWTLIDRLCRDGKAFVEMDEVRLTTTSWRIVALKPVV
jgi:sterol 24-C-methyltransferase